VSITATYPKANDWPSHLSVIQEDNEVAVIMLQRLGLAMAALTPRMN